MDHNLKVGRVHLLDLFRFLRCFTLLLRLLLLRFALIAHIEEVDSLAEERLRLDLTDLKALRAYSKMVLEMLLWHDIFGLPRTGNVLHVRRVHVGVHHAVGGLCLVWPLPEGLAARLLLLLEDEGALPWLWSCLILLFALLLSLLLTSFFELWLFLITCGSCTFCFFFWCLLSFFSCFLIAGFVCFYHSIFTILFTRFGIK